MAVEKLQTKLIERAVQKFAAALLGVAHFEIRRSTNEDFANHQKTVTEFCGIDSAPLCKWRHPVDEDGVIDFLGSRISALGLGVYIPCERPFVIKADISDCAAFVRSIWHLEGTKDMTLYIEPPVRVLQLQDLEYDLVYFEVAPKLVAE